MEVLSEGEIRKTGDDQAEVFPGEVEFSKGKISIPLLLSRLFPENFWVEPNVWLSLGRVQEVGSGKGTILRAFILGF